MGAVLTEAPADWSRKLSLPATLPQDDRAFWIVTDEMDVIEVAYSQAAYHYTHRHEWARQEADGGYWSTDQILGWTDSYDDAREAADLLKEAVQ